MVHSIIQHDLLSNTGCFSQLLQPLVLARLFSAGLKRLLYVNQLSTATQTVRRVQCKFWLSEIW